MQYKLYRVEDDATTTFISEHTDLLEGMAAGKQIVEHIDLDFAYALHADGVRLTTFAKGRIGYREWAHRNGRLPGDYIHSLDDRHDHDVDEVLNR